MNKKQLYESIMRSVSREVKKALNESTPIDDLLCISNIRINRSSIRISRNGRMNDDIDAVKWSAKINPGSMTINNEPVETMGGTLSGYITLDSVNDFFGNELIEYSTITEYDDEQLKSAIINEIQHNNDPEIRVNVNNIKIEDNNSTIIGNRNETNLKAANMGCNVFYIHLNDNIYEL